ncbi:GNAT family N-acetyltransferase [Alsobacter soli]|uniref:GNAT family N-acetyltransferase n=1 Tax=Alsobacter soli TaxID=2109933 RepID=A0A2T1HVM3_9HYPH|nr:GNAT family N-acetyltransferase [Alsobacter soli]PSC05722.1 GNAT family N-acetyltransferase [Alsobacter soli]
MTYRLTHDHALRRFDLWDESTPVAHALYEERGDRLAIYHTEVLRSLRGRGIGGELVARVLDEVRSTGKGVIPACPFVREFMAQNPEYGDLLGEKPS